MENKENEIKKVMPHLVVFLDILGTKERVKAANDFEELDQQLLKLDSAIEKNLELLKSVSEIFNGKLNIFSDSIILSIPLRGDSETRKFDDVRFEITENIRFIAGFQSGLFNDGFPLCGGMAIGWGFFNDSICFGPALIEAWEVEESSRLPAIFFDSVLIEWTQLKIKRKRTGPYNEPFNWILSDNDGKYFINYLYFIIELAEFEANKRDKPFEIRDIFQLYPYGEEELKYHKNIIEKYLPNEKLASKYKWLASYHNYFCTNYLLDGESFLIKCETTHTFEIVA